MIKFAHVRAVAPAKHYPGRKIPIPTEKANKGGYTIAFEQDETIPGNVYYSVARCNAKDNFCKRTGRAIAEGRLNAGNYSKLVTRATKYGTIINKIIPLVEEQIAHARKNAAKRKK